MPEISRETIQKAAVGDIAAFEEIYNSTSAFVYNVALRVTGNAADADEVAQDVFVKVYRGPDYRSIADTLGVNINTVRTRIKRAREKLVALGRKG
jgi:DNA-directed RNA polymerase specialized sigma24 family protein